MNCPKLNIIVPCYNAVIGAGSLVTKDISLPIHLPTVYHAELLKN